MLPRRNFAQGKRPVRNSLISQIIKRLARDGTLKAIAPLVHSDGCVNTVAKLIGEIQRAAINQAELQIIVDARASDLNPALNQEIEGGAVSPEHSIPLQIDF